MLITSINYQNNLLFGLTFWLFSLSLVAMILTFRNLAGLTVIAGKAQPCFVGEKSALPVLFETSSSRHQDRKSTRLNSSHVRISYAVFCLKKKKKKHNNTHGYNVLLYK